MEVQRRRARSCRGTRRRRSRPSARPTRLSPRRSHATSPQPEQRPADDQVGDRRVELAGLVRRPLGADAEREPGRDERDARAASRPALRRAGERREARADSSAFAMNPRALLSPSRRRYDDASRLDVSTTTGAASSRGELLADREPVDVRQLDVQQHERRLERARRRQRRGAVVRLADDLEPAGLQQRAGERAEVGVVVDDQDGRAHAAIVARRPGPTSGLTLARAARTAFALVLPPEQASLRRLKTLLARRRGGAQSRTPASRQRSCLGAPVRPEARFSSCWTASTEQSGGLTEQVVVEDERRRVSGFGSAAGVIRAAV